MYSEERPAETGKRLHIVPGSGGISSGIFFCNSGCFISKKTLGMGQCSSKKKGTKSLFSVDLVL